MIFRRRFSTLHFLQDLHIFMRQRFHLIQSLYCLEQQQNFSCVPACLQALQQGQYLHQALQNFPNQFDPIVIMFIRMGELTGRLPDTLKCAVAYLKFRQSLAEKSKKYLFYPILLFGVLFSVLYCFVHIIIPQMETTPVSFNTWNVAFTFFILDAVLVLFVLLAVFLIVRTLWPWFRAKTVSWLFYIPLVGSQYYKLQQGYFLKILSILLSEKVPAMWALDCLQTAIPFPKIRHQYAKCALALKEGHSVSKGLQYLDCIKGAIVDIDAESWHTRLDDIAETQLQSAQEHLSSMIRMIEPLMVLLTGGVIVMIISALFVPLYEHLHVMV